MSNTAALSPFNELTAKAKVLRATLRKRNPTMRLCVSQAHGGERVHAAWVTWDGTRQGLVDAFADVHLATMAAPKVMLFATHMAVAHHDAPGEDVTGLMMSFLSAPAVRAPKAKAA